MSESANEVKVGRRLRRALGTQVTAPIEDPLKELKDLVKQDKALTKSKVAIHHMASDRKARNDNPPHWKKGDKIPCRLPLDTREALIAQCYDIDRKRNELKGLMRARLKGIPIYDLFLSKVCGLGTITAAYLVTDIDIRKCEKSSSLRRYCGLAVINGSLERRSGGPKATGGTGTYNQTLRTSLFLCFTAMWRNCSQRSDLKYITIWKDAKNRIANSDRVENKKTTEDGKWTGKIRLSQPRTGKNGKSITHVSAPGFAHSTGWHKAADVLVEDIYTVWRAIEGLPVWPSYYAAKLGYQHGGKISVNAPRMLTVDEALEMVGVKGLPDQIDDLDDSDLSVDLEDMPEAAE